MKKKEIVIGAIVLGLVALFACGIFRKQKSQKYDGSAVESREMLLNKASTNSRNWTIVAEQKIEDYMISGACSTDNKAAIAVFEPAGTQKYRLLTSTSRNNEEIIVETSLINGEQYNLIWFHGAQTEYAEVTCTINGQEQPPIRYDTTQMGVICQKAPAKEYTIQVCYYDRDGNKYE